MKNIKLIITLLIFTLSFSSCNNKTNTDTTGVYQCPMKCEGEKTFDTPGNCTVCKMDLKETKWDVKKEELKEDEGKVKNHLKEGGDDVKKELKNADGDVKKEFEKLKGDVEKKRNKTSPIIPVPNGI